MTRQIFSWDEIDRYGFDEDGSEAQIISGEHMHLIRAVYEPGSTYPMHSHPHEQFSLLLSGRILLTVGDETREIGPGDGWYAASNVPHGGQIIGDQKAVFIDVYSPATRWVYDILDTAQKLSPGGPVE
ncbi:MAG: cupin domain-containing protein [Arenicellales bacterium]|nr:cupin domain-containing protein [Arenicellales bacterium]